MCGLPGDRRRHRYLNLTVAVVLPAGVVTATAPDFALVGTVTVSLLPETILNLAGTPPNVTDVVVARFVPLNVTVAPFFAVAGTTAVTVGVGAAIGMKLAFPDKTIIAMTGDGSFMFSVPSTVHWMARKYETPFLQVVFNNRGWKAPKMSTLAMHPQGYASRAEDIGVSFDPPPDYSAIAAASGGAYARIVRHAGELQDALKKALDVVRVERRCAVLDVWLPHL